MTYSPHRWQLPFASSEGVCASCGITIDDVDLLLEVPCPAPECPDPGNDGACVFVVTSNGAECSYCGREGATGEREDPDADPEIAEYSARTLPTGPWVAHERTTPVRMTPLAGPATVATAHGDVSLDEGWSGWLAVDGAGHPYPISDAEKRRAFRESEQA